MSAAPLWVQILPVLFSVLAGVVMYLANRPPRPARPVDPVDPQLKYLTEEDRAWVANMYQAAEMTPPTWGKPALPTGESVATTEADQLRAANERSLRWIQGKCTHAHTVSEQSLDDPYPVVVCVDCGKSTLESPLGSLT